MACINPILHASVSALVGGPTGGVRVSAVHIRDMLYGGDEYIAGVVTEDGVPYASKVYLLDRRNLFPVRSCVSGPDGSYRFDNIVHGSDYAVISFDKERVYNAVIADGIAPVRLP